VFERRLIATIGTMALSFALASTAAAQIDVSNSTVTCNTVIKGSIKLAPALITGGALPTAFKIKGKLGGCTTNAGGVTLLDGKSSFSGVVNVPTNDCAALLNPGAVSGTITVKWKATPAILPTSSTITLDSGDATAGLFATGWGAPYGYFGLGINPRPSGNPGNPLAVAGAFTGGSGGVNSTADIVTGEDTALILGQCGGAGVKAITIAIGQLKLG
jgi:hypothetical protein